MKGATESDLMVGTAQVEITPQARTQMAGAVGVYRPARYTLDPLFARALVIQNAQDKVCIVALDLTIVTSEWTQRIRDAVKHDCGLEPGAVMVLATQTHSAPCLGHFMVDPDFRRIPAEMEWLKGGETSYFEFAFKRIVQAIKDANSALEPAFISAGTGIEGGLAFNRRAVTRDNRVRMPGRNRPGTLGPTYMRYLEGPVDHEVGVVSFHNRSSRVLALLLHYTCHPVNVFHRPVISADWPGAWARAMQATLGTSCTPLVLNGCCGNINPWDPFDPLYQPDHERMGRLLAKTALAIMEHSDEQTLQAGPALSWAAKKIALPVREVPPQLLARAQQVLAADPEPALDKKNPQRVNPEWMKAASIMSVHLMRQREPYLPYEIQAFRLGACGLVGLPGEPFVEGQLKIKLQAPCFPVLVAHCSGQYAGYLPTRDAFPRGGHEVETRYWAKLEPDALERVVQAATELLRSLF